MAETKALTVLYNGACPICGGEVLFYKRRKGADDLTWVDLSRFAEDEVVAGLPKHQALTCLHVLHDDGTLVSGGAALAALWTALPGFRPWGKVVRVVFPGGQTRSAGDVSNWPVGDLRSDHAEDRENVPSEGDSARFAVRRNVLVRSIARLRPRAAK